MKRQTILPRVLSLGLLAAGVAAQAQLPTGTADDGEVEEPRRYTVEMIIFEYTEDVGLGTEVFVPDLVEPDVSVVDEIDASVIVDEIDAADAGEEPVAVDLDIQTTPRAELTMDETLSRLERLDAYRPLMHFGWTQATVPEELSSELPLARFGAPPAGLDGSLKLYLNRFLHLVVDVSKLAPDAGVMPRPAQSSIDLPVDRFGDRADERSFDRDVMAPEYEPLRYRIREDRIMKNGETRYYDHPRIGIIAKVTRVEEEDDESASAGF